MPMLHVKSDEMSVCMQPHHYDYVREIPVASQLQLSLSQWESDD